MHPLYSSFPRYIDSIPEYFRGHENHASFHLVNTKRWINDFLETEGHELPNGNTHAAFSLDMMEWIHPNKIGHARIADMLVKELGVPRSATQSLPPEESPIAEPEAETEAREPISAWVQGSYAHPIGKPLRLDARGSYSARGKIATYEWDLDGDGQFDHTTTRPMLTYTWTKEFVGKITLRITSELGATATTTTDAMITNDDDSTPYARDNCPEVYNYGQTDYDKDGIGDACDPTPGYPTEDLPGVIEGDPPTPLPTPSHSPSASPTKSPSPTPSKTPSVTPLAKSVPVGHGITHTFGVAECVAISGAERDTFTHGLTLGERIATTHDDTECLTNGALALRDGCPNGDCSTDAEPQPDTQPGTNRITNWSSAGTTVTDQRTSTDNTTAANGPRAARSPGPVASCAD